jgi:hypothetical protein
MRTTLASFAPLLVGCGSAAERGRQEGAELIDFDKPAWMAAW